MDCKDLIVDGLSRIEEGMRTVLDGMAAEQLAFRPQPASNSIAWLAWHIARVEDDHISELAGQPQAWVAGGWHARFGRAADPRDTGFGHGPEQVAGIAPDSSRVLLEYHQAVHQRSLAYIETVSCTDLDRIVDRRFNPPVTAGVRLVSVIDDCAQHMGQMAYVRGLIEGRRWLPW